ncbi:hypothetical protein Mal48_33310 [Thalassoglobus polymorphus]|uniref:Uncharacterized protein n=1 Tax=Thalassoglobus polymorphus TaxID=2527994 RepID=A0A517QR19_9PLAN|nr:hypothetical protein Mal48_33310 [Thalassoglobus polymorphus]
MSVSEALRIVFYRGLGKSDEFEQTSQTLGIVLNRCDETPMFKVS